MSKIAISYRRSDSTAIAGRIADRLSAHYGPNSVFIDVDSIPLGTDFRKHIAKVWSEIDVLIAIVGPQWLKRKMGAAPRINDPEDLVRIEIETALERDILIIPVLVEGGKMPSADRLPASLRAFADRNAAEVDGGRDFHPHMDRLIEAIDRIAPGRVLASRDTLPAAAASGHDRSPTIPHSDTWRFAPTLVHVVLPVLVLLVAHHLIVNVFDLSTGWLRLASFALPAPFGVLAALSERRGWFFSIVISGTVAVLAVAGMCLSAGLWSRQSIVPASLQEWREAIEYLVSIDVAWLAGYSIARLFSFRSGDER
jgi:hypothetical protein